MSRADEFRNNAVTLRQLAKNAIKPEERDAWLDIATHWEHLAQEADRYPAAFPVVDGI